MGLILTVDQKCALSGAFSDKHGNAARIDGKPIWNTSDASIVGLNHSDDGFSCVAVAGSVGTAQVTFSGDADLGDGVRQVIATLDIEIHPLEAISAGISAGAPEDK